LMNYTTVGSLVPLPSNTPAGAYVNTSESNTMNSASITNTASVSNTQSNDSPNNYIPEGSRQAPSSDKFVYTSSQTSVQIRTDSPTRFIDVPPSASTNISSLTHSYTGQFTSKVPIDVIDTSLQKNQQPQRQPVGGSYISPVHESSNFDNASGSSSNYQLGYSTFYVEKLVPDDFNPNAPLSLPQASEESVFGVLRQIDQLK